MTVHSRAKRLGRRGGLLLLLAVLWAGVAAQVAVTHAPYDAAVAVLHERIPAGWRVGLWLTCAAVMAAAALAGTRDPRVQRIGWAAALLIPAERAAGYLWSVVMVLLPGPPPYTSAENAAADAAAALAATTAANTALLSQLQAGIAAIRAARDAAQGDIPVAQAARDSMDAGKTAVTARKAAATAWTPATTGAMSTLTATTTAVRADVAAIKSEIITILGYLEAVAQALREQLAYRVAVDTNAVLTDNAILWLAKQASGDVLAPEA